MDPSRTPALAAISLLVTLAACASNPPARGTANSQLAQSAEALEQNARVLASRSDAMPPSFKADAHELQQHAYDLRMATASGRASDSELRADFDQVTRSYQALRSEAQQLDSQEAHGALDLVDGPYHDVAAQLGNSKSGTAPGT